LYFNFFSASFCTTFLSAAIATFISAHVLLLLLLLLLVVVVVVVVVCNTSTLLCFLSTSQNTRSFYFIGA
jgi:hypothetical protein